MNYFLSIDNISENPSFTINNQTIFLRENSNNYNARCESSDLINKILKSLELLNYEFSDIEIFTYCSGPGGFSSLRTVNIISRLLFRLKPSIRIYKFTLTNLLFRKFNIKEIYLKAGLNSYFKETYDENNNIKEKCTLIKTTLPLDKNIIETNNLNLSAFMRDIILNSNSNDLENLRTKEISEILPDYFREANITVSKKN